jgi:hypothetical protein
MRVRASSILPAMARAAASASALDSVQGCPYFVGLAARRKGSSLSPPLLRAGRGPARERQGSARGNPVRLQRGCVRRASERHVLQARPGAVDHRSAGARHERGVCRRDDALCNWRQAHAALRTPHASAAVPPSASQRSAKRAHPARAQTKLARQAQAAELAAGVAPHVRLVQLQRAKPRQNLEKSG